MLPQQKEALFALPITVVIGLLFFMSPTLFQMDHFTWALALILIHIALLWILRRLVGIRKQALDERDIRFRYQSGIIALSIFSGNIVLGCLALIATHLQEQTIPITSLISVLFCCWMSLYLTWAVTTLVLYHREG